MTRIPIITNPKMFDAVVAEIQVILGDKFAWLDHVFGLAETITRYIDGRKFKCATVFRNNEHGEQYEQIEPCAELGNFCFFLLKDPQTIGETDSDMVTAPFSVIFWYDMRQVSNEPVSRNREEVKGRVLSVLTDLHLKNGSVSFNRVYEDPERIFAEYSYDHTQNQCLMSPYAGIRIDGEITANIPCYDNI